MGHTVAHGLGLPAQPSWGYGPLCSDGACAPGALTVRGALDGGPVVLGRRRGLATEHRGVSGEAPGMVRQSRTHRSGGAMVRQLAAAVGSIGRRRALVGPVA
jgi:hypothetical protein